MSIQVSVDNNHFIVEDAGWMKGAHRVYDVLNEWDELVGNVFVLPGEDVEDVHAATIAWYQQEKHLIAG